MQGRMGWRSWGLLVAAATLLPASGCLSFMHPLKTPPHELGHVCRNLSDHCRDHVHIYFINGCDPLNKDNLVGVCDYYRDLGYRHAHYGQMVHSRKFKREIRRIHKEDPDARFVLLGFSFGANLVRSMANDLKPDGITIDLLVYLGGDTLFNRPENRPANVARVLNLRGQGAVGLCFGMFNGEDIEGAENHLLDHATHAQLPTDTQMLQTLTSELIAVTAGGSPGATPLQSAAAGGQ